MQDEPTVSLGTACMSSYFPACLLGVGAPCQVRLHECSVLDLGSWTCPLSFAD